MKWWLKNYTNQWLENLKGKKSIAKFKDNIWATYLAEMRSLSSKNRGVKYLLCAIDLFTKYTWVKPLKDKSTKTIFQGFNEIVNESKRKPNKLWFDQGWEIYNGLMQKWFDGNMLIHLTQNVGKSTAAKRFIRTLKDK